MAASPARVASRYRTATNLTTSKYDAFWAPLMDGTVYYWSSSIHREFDTCHHCGRSVSDEPFYMVKNPVWLQEAGMKEVPNDPVGGPFMHLRCLEIRIGRALTPRDFTSARVNAWVLKPRRR